MSAYSFPILSISDETLASFYRLMLLIRRFEERVGQVYTQGKIGGFCHLYIGQEAIAVAASAAMGDKDSSITSYRAHGHMLARGASARSIMAELMGRATGTSKGKGGSMHTFFPEKRFYGGHGIVGAQISLGTGLAFAHRYCNDGGVSLTFLGDGAANQGQFFESMNMAALWGLPVLYVIENNGYGMGTSVSRACAGSNLYQRGQPFGIDGIVCQGSDVIELFSILKGAIEQIRTQKHPLILEIRAHRFRGHSMSDPATYRTKEELESAKISEDPLICLGEYLRTHCGFEDADFKKMEQSVKEEVSDALQFSENSLPPDVSEFYTDVLAATH